MEMMPIRFVVIFFSLLLMVDCSNPVPPNEAEPSQSDSSFTIKAEDQCPVCGMTIQEHAKFAASIELKTGEHFFTCGPGCMVRCWVSTEHYLGHPQQAIARMQVQEFFSGRIMDVDNVVFIVGSDFIGPMGRTIAPVDPKHETTYLKRHGGDQVIQLKSLDKEKWEAIQKKF